MVNNVFLIINLTKVDDLKEVAFFNPSHSGVDILLIQNNAGVLTSQKHIRNKFFKEEGPCNKQLTVLGLHRT